ncbi:protein ALP1-like [Aphis craccivora]|uniref:Protein ALP1-like n=1 Tax=Aphis craccivora TaxID=307492 RepID=A0A6G0XZT9_APHCR|nr:protein ALP1-like [Aphis craccivora]
MPAPNSQEQWTDIANKFYKKTNFPNCIGAVDGKHIRCVNPRNAGSIFFNYKKYFSIILMGVLDAEYCFTTIDVGAYGKEADSAVFKECPFGRKLYSEELNLPTPTCLPNTTDSPQPFVLVADEAFGLHKNLLRSYPGRGLDEKQKIFNYRLSRARRYVECAFGILSNKWRVLHTPILVEPDFTDCIVKACCILHNFVRRRDGYQFEDTFFNDLDDIQNYGNAGVRHEGVDVRDYFANYFVNAGSVPFQYR